MLLLSQSLLIVCLFCINSVPGLFCQANDDVAKRWVAVPRVSGLPHPTHPPQSGKNGQWVNLYLCFLEPLCSLLQV